MELDMDWKAVIDQKKTLRKIGGTKQKTNTMNKHFFESVLRTNLKFAIKGVLKNDPCPKAGPLIKTYKKHSTLSIKNTW